MKSGFGVISSSARRRAFGWSPSSSAPAGAWPERQRRLAAHVHVRLHQQAAELAVVGRRDAHRHPKAPGPVDRDPQHEGAVLVVLAAHGLVRDDVVEARLVLRHPPDPLAALDRDLRADRQVEDVLAESERTPQRERKEGRSRPAAARAGDSDAELDVLPDVGQRVVDDRDQQHGPAPEPSGVDLVPGQQRGRLREVDSERRHQRGSAVGVDGEHERDAVHERMTPGLPLHPSRNHLLSARARPASAGTLRGLRPCR